MVMNDKLKVDLNGFILKNPIMTASGTYGYAEEYNDFIVSCDSFNEKNIKSFAYSIDRDPGIVLGRLLLEHKVSYSDTELCKRLRHTFNALK